MTPGQHRVRGATEWFIYKLASRKLGRWSFPIRRVFGQLGCGHSWHLGNCSRM